MIRQRSPRRHHHLLVSLVLYFCCCYCSTVKASRAVAPDHDHHQARWTEFVREMQRIEDDKNELKFRQEQESLLQEALMQSARRLTPELARQLQFDNDYSDREEDRDLAYNDDLYYNYGYQNYNNNNQYYNYNNNDNYQQNYNNGGQYYNQNSLNLTKYALKYIGCQNIHTWSDDRVEAGLSPMKMDRFVVLRLCEADTCSAYNKWGCNAEFGEYVLPMDDYLAIMSKYHFGQYNRYCQTCNDCMNFDYQAYMGTPAPTPAATNADDVYVAEENDDAWAGNGDDDWYWSHYFYGDGNNNNRRLGQNYNYNNNNGYNDYGYNYKNGYSDYNYNYGNNNYQQKRLPWYLNQDGTCAFSTVCDNYRNACKNYHPNATYYQDYFTCTQYQVANGVQYVGPHCRSDGHTIGIAIYEDEYCNEFSQEMSNNHYDDNELSLFYDDSCLSCKASDGYTLIKDAYVTEHAETYPLCEALYDYSAKCHMYLDSENELYSDQTESQKTICTFIGTLIENTYNEYGEIIIQQDFNFYNWQSKMEYLNLARKASPAQIAGIVVSLATSLALLVYSCYLHKKLFFRQPWRPPKSITSPVPGSGCSVASRYARSEAGRLSRNNSGIMAMRSVDLSERGGSRGVVAHGDMSYATHGDISALTGPSKGAFA